MARMICAIRVTARARARIADSIRGANLVT